MIRNAMLLMCMFWVGQTALAHGGVHERIEKLNSQIKENPQDPTLYMERGVLYHIHESFDTASWDFEKVLELSPDFYNVHLYLAEAYIEMGAPENAVLLLDNYTDLYKDNFKWYTIRGNALFKQGRYEASAEDFLAVLRLRKKVVPQDYFNYAQAESMRGPEGITKAIHVIDQAESTMGWLIVLQEYIIDLELKRENFKGAMARLDGIIAKAPRKEKWLARKGDILIQAGQSQRAMDTYNQALEAIAQLPHRNRNTPSIIDLEKSIIQSIKNLF